MVLGRRCPESLEASSWPGDEVRFGFLFARLNRSWVGIRNALPHTVGWEGCSGRRKENVGKVLVSVAHAVICIAGIPYIRAIAFGVSLGGLFAIAGELFRAWQVAGCRRAVEHGVLAPVRLSQGVQTSYRVPRQTDR